LTATPSTPVANAATTNDDHDAANQVGGTKPIAFASQAHASDQ